MTGDAQPLPDVLAPDARARQRNRMLLLADELRESALAAAAIEAYLVKLHRLLDSDSISLDELAAFADDAAIERRIGDLDDGIAALRRSIRQLADPI